jgi:K+-dependent Na+/Ca+ exchanger family protein
VSLILTTIILLVFGLTILIRFSDIFVSAASSLSLSLKVPKMLIALTIAAFGTCAPELAISFNSIKSGASDMTLANVIGSCIVNILLIVGLSAITRPIKVKERTIKKELPLLVIITTAFFILVTDSLFKKSAVNSLSRADAIMLLIWFILFMFYIIGIVRKNKNNEYDIPEYSIVKSIILIIFSLLAITLSSNIVVDNAVLLASQIGISQKIISMTVIVIGTSLPELTMTINAARKDEFDMAVGNIIGTNIFNICIVLGLPIAIYGGVSSSSFNVVDTSVVLLSALMFYLFGRSNKELSRREGLLMVLVFILYYTYVFIS